MTKIKVKESVLRNMIKEALLKEYNNNYHDIRPGSLGNHSGGESSINSVPQTNDLNIVDMGYASPEKRQQWKSMGRVPNVEFYPGKDPIKMSAHMRHLKSLYGGRIEFFAYNNGTYVFFKFDGKPEYLKPASLNSEYK